MAGGGGGSRGLVAPMGAELAPYQLSQRFIVVEGRHVEAEDLPVGRLANPLHTQLRELAEIAGILRSRWEPPEKELRAGH